MTDLTAYGFDAERLRGHSPNELPARVTAVHRGQLEAVCVHGVLDAQLKAGAYYGDADETFPAVGDFVSLQYNALGSSLITATQRRTSKFSRSDYSGHGAGYAKTVVEQVVAANFDTVFILQSLNHDLNLKRIDRYLTMAWQSGGVPVILLTKADLAPDADALRRSVEDAAPGVEVYAVSTQPPQGLEAVRRYLTPGRTAVFLGSSGVGKSSLVNALAGEELMKVQSIREDDSKGRHTTTHRQLILLPGGGMIIDTPGMRELGLFDAQEGLSETFADIEALASGCRFSDCTHEAEPGCAIRRAIEDGALSEARWRSYRQLAKENRFLEDKTAYLRERDQLHKNLSQSIRQMYK